MQEKKKVLKVEVSEDRYCSCNVCCKRVSSKEKNEAYKVEEMYDLSFGKENLTTVIRLCNGCLSEFAEILWQFLESEEIK